MLPLFQETYHFQATEAEGRYDLPDDVRSTDVAQPLYWHPPAGGNWIGRDYPLEPQL